MDFESDLNSDIEDPVSNDIAKRMADKSKALLETPRKRARDDDLLSSSTFGKPRSFHGQSDVSQISSHSKKKAKTNKQSSPSHKPVKPAPKRSRKANKDLDLHPGYKRILDKDFSNLPGSLKFTDGPDEASLLRAHVGRWTDEDGTSGKAWMFPAPQQVKSGSGKSEVKMNLYKFAVNGGRFNQIQSSNVTFLNGLGQDERFEGVQGRYRPVATRADDRKAAHSNMLVDYYFHLQPNERNKLRMSKKDKEEIRKKAISMRKSEGENQSDEKEIQGVNHGNKEVTAQEYRDILNAEYPDLDTDAKIWEAYEFDTVNFSDRAADILKSIGDAWTVACPAAAGCEPPDVKVLREALIRKRQTGVDRCTLTNVFVDWQIRSRGGSKTHDLIDLKVAPMEAIEATRKGRNPYEPVSKDLPRWPRWALRLQTICEEEPELIETFRAAWARLRHSYKAAD